MIDIISQGYLNEIEIVKELNNKKITEINYLYQNMIEKLYGVVQRDTKIYAKINFGKKKYDFVIYINNIPKYISVKKGSKNSFHTESIKKFIIFLKECKIPQEIINKYIHFHYGEDYEEGYKRVMNSAEYKLKYQGNIDQVNIYFNKNSFIENALYRFVLQGTNRNEKIIDGVLSGTKDVFEFYSRNDIIRIVEFHKNKKSTGVHFSCLFIAPHNRCINNNLKYYDARNSIQVKWYNVFDDYMLMKMQESYDNFIINKY